MPSARDPQTSLKSSRDQDDLRGYQGREDVEGRFLREIAIPDRRAGDEPARASILPPGEQGHQIRVVKKGEAPSAHFFAEAIEVPQCARTAVAPDGLLDQRDR